MYTFRALKVLVPVLTVIIHTEMYFFPRIKFSEFWVVRRDAIMYNKMYVVLDRVDGIQP